MAGERVLSTGYSLSKKKVRMDSPSILPTSLLRIVQAVCGHFLSFHIFVFPLLLIRDLVHDTGTLCNLFLLNCS